MSITFTFIIICIIILILMSLLNTKIESFAIDFVELGIDRNKEDLTDKPLIYFKFNNNDLNAYGSYTKQLINKNCVSYSLDYVKGNGSVKFNGNSSLILSLDNSFTFNDFTVAFFTKIVYKKGISTLVSYTFKNPTLGWIIQINEVNLEIIVGANIDNNWTKIITVQDFIKKDNSEWYHITLSYNNDSKWNLYINGEKYTPTLNDKPHTIYYNTFTPIKYINKNAICSGTRNINTNNLNVTVWYHCDWQGGTATFGIGFHEMPDWLKYQSSAMYIPPGLEVVLYRKEYSYYGGYNWRKSRKFSPGHHSCFVWYGYNDWADHIEVIDTRTPEVYTYTCSSFAYQSTPVISTSTGYNYHMLLIGANNDLSFTSATENNSYQVIPSSEINLSLINYLSENSLIDDFIIYNKTLSNDKIKELFLGIPIGSTQANNNNLQTTDCDGNDINEYNNALIALPSYDSTIADISEIEVITNNNTTAKFKQTFTANNGTYILLFSEVINSPNKKYSPVKLFNRSKLINTNDTINYCGFFSALYNIQNCCNYDENGNYALNLKVPDCNNITFADINRPKGEYIYIKTPEKFILKQYGIKAIPEFLHRAPKSWTLYIYDTNINNTISYKYPSESQNTLNIDNYCAYNNYTHIVNVNFSENNEIKSDEYLFVFDSIIGRSTTELYKILAFEELFLYKKDESI